MKRKYIPLVMMCAISFLNPSWGAESPNYSVNYETEYEAAVQGQDWYDASLIPTIEEMSGDLGSTSSIKIRLPIDLKRIIDDDKKNGKPML